MVEIFWNNPGEVEKEQKQPASYKDRINPTDHTASKSPTSQTDTNSVLNTQSPNDYREKQSKFSRPVFPPQTTLTTVAH